MTRKLLLLNLILLVGVGLLGFQLRREWREAQTREQALFHYRLTLAPAPILAPLRSVTVFEAATYADVAQNNLFSKDRNPNVIVHPPPPPAPKPIPAFPVARGVMLWEGTPPTIVLSEKAGAPQKACHPGDVIGEWKIVSIDNKYVVFAWDGKQFQKRIDELLDKAPVEVASAAPSAPAAQVSRPGNVALGGPASTSGVDMGNGLRSCVAGDTTPVGTVKDGMKKVVTASPFGSVCRWEPVK